MNRFDPCGRLVSRLGVVAVAAALTLASVVAAPVATASPVVTPGLQSRSLSVGTWNTDLEPWFTTQQSVIDTIAGTSFDVLGLQGVWSDAAENAIVTDPRIAQKYPYSYYPAAQPKSASCPSFVPRYNIEDFVDAVIAAGADPRQLEQSTLPLPFDVTFLGLNLQLISQPCFGAIVNLLQSLPPGADPHTVIDLAYAGNGAQYAHGGSTGQLILSDKPLQDITTTSFDTFEVRRANIYATVAGVRIAFAAWARNVLEDFSPALASLQAGALQPEMSADAIIQHPDLVVGSFNSGPGYQSEGTDLLVNNGYQRLTDQTTYCPAATHASFAVCQNEYSQLFPGPPAGPVQVDNVYAATGSRCESLATFATDPVSDHIGVSAICAVHAAPVAQNDVYSVDQGSTLTVGAPGVLGNDTDDFGDPLPAIVVTPPAHASSFTLNPDGSFTYTPTTGYLGPDSFTYSVSDGDLVSNVATVSITVRPSFPKTGVLDTFNRADSPVGPAWAGPRRPLFYRVSGQRLDVQLGGPLVWNAATFGTTQEAFVTLHSIDPRGPAQGVLLKTQNATGTDATGIVVAYDARAKAVRVSALRLGALTVYPAKAATLANDDVFGARALANGSVAVYRNGLLLTTVTMTGADTAFFATRGGRIGIWTLASPSALLDDFGGGTVG